MELQQIQQLLSNNSGEVSLMITTETNVKLKGGKKNPLQGKVTKTTTGSKVLVSVGGDQSLYENKIKQQMQQEGKDPLEFQLKPRAWGTRVDNTPIIFHKDKYYLECLFVSSGDTSYFVDGEQTDKDSIEGLPEVNVSEKSQGGVENKIIIRTFSIDSIKAIKLV